MNGVVVDVAVRDRRGPVRDLRASDFLVEDNGVPQVAALTSIENLPVDVSLVIDLGGGASAGSSRQPLDDATTIAEVLRPIDRLEVIGYDRSVLAGGYLQGGSRPQFGDFLSVFHPQEGEIDCAGRDGVRLKETALGTAVFDALARALLSPASPGRRHLVLMWTGGREKTSLTTSTQLLAMAGRTDAGVYILRPDVPTDCRGLGIGAAFDVLDEVASRTGGLVRVTNDIVASFSQSPNPGSILALFKDVLGELRQRYVLEYQPSGVVGVGWHSISVRVNRPGTVVSARKGYED